MPGQTLFCDGSFNPQLKIGVGAVLLLSGDEWEQSKEGDTFAIRTQVMKASSIARVELMTVIWALSLPGLLPGVQLFTDSKTIEGLSGRREKLEAVRFQSQRTGLRLANSDLYEEFFRVGERLRPRVTWIKGHSPRSGRSEYQRVFGFVDRQARKVLREIGSSGKAFRV